MRGRNMLSRAKWLKSWQFASLSTKLVYKTRQVNFFMNWLNRGMARARAYLLAHVEGCFGLSPTRPSLSLFCHCLMVFPVVCTEQNTELRPKQPGPIGRHLGRDSGNAPLIHHRSLQKALNYSLTNRAIVSTDTNQANADWMLTTKLLVLFNSKYSLAESPR